MGTIQDDAKPLVLELNKTGLRKLDDAETLKIALWITTAVMVIDAAHPPTQVISRHVRHAYGSAGTSRRPPGGWQIFAAPFSEPQLPGFFWHRALVIPDPETGMLPKIVTDEDRAQMTTFSVGNILFHTFSHHSERPEVVPSLYGILFNLQPIWPTRGLPRGAPYSAADVEELMENGPNAWITS